jgi:glycosyltransferase involved in cell wall biosynthesis
MDPEQRLTVIIPAFNEEENLKVLLPPLLDHCREMNWHIVLVNDGSHDETKHFMKEFENDPILEVIHHKLNKGYGAALKSGIRACKTEYLITFDADGQHTMEDIGNLLRVIVDQDADMVVGSRKSAKSASYYRGIGKSFIRFLAKILMTVPIYDLNSGMKIYRTELAQRYLMLVPDTMAFSDIIALVFLNNRHLVLEEPIRIKARMQGKSAIGLETAFHTIMEIIHIVILFNPMKIFLPLSLFCFIITGLWATPLLIQGRGLSIGGLLGVVLGLLLFLLGLIAEQLSLIRRNQHN